MIDLNDLAAEAAAVAERNGADKRNTHLLLGDCAEKVTDATEAYGIMTETFIRIRSFSTPDGAVERRFASALADIICCALIIAGRENIDIEKALLDCMERDRKRSEGTEETT